MSVDGTPQVPAAPVVGLDLTAPKETIVRVLVVEEPPKLALAAPEAGVVESELRVGLQASNSDVRIAARLGNADPPGVSGAPNVGRSGNAAFVFCCG